MFCRSPQFSRRSKAKKAEVCKPWLVTGAVLRCAMTKALQLAMAKAAALPEAAQEQLGREILERIDRLNELRAAINVGIRELDAGLERN